MTIKELNESVRCTLGISKVHGIGVMAIKDIAKGEKLYCVGVQRKWLKLNPIEYYDLNEDVKRLINQRWPLAKRGTPFLHPNGEVWLLSFMNHGEGDGVNYDKYTDTAIRDIKKGEEILENYGELTEQLLNV